MSIPLRALRAGGRRSADHVQRRHLPPQGACGHSDGAGHRWRDRATRTRQAVLSRRRQRRGAADRGPDVAHLGRWHREAARRRHCKATHWEREASHRKKHTSRPGGAGSQHAGRGGVGPSMRGPSMRGPQPAAASRRQSASGQGPRLRGAAIGRDEGSVLGQRTKHQSCRAGELEGLAARTPRRFAGAPFLCRRRVEVKREVHVRGGVQIRATAKAANRATRGLLILGQPAFQPFHRSLPRLVLGLLRARHPLTQGAQWL